MIKIIGLGPGSINSLTLGALEALESGAGVFLRTEKHPVVDYIKQRGIVFQTYDSFYEAYDNFDAVYEAIAKDVISKYESCKEVVYAVPGHPLVAEKSVTILIKYCEEKVIPYELVTAVSFIDVMMERLKIDPVEGMEIIDAFEISSQVFNKRLGTIVTQVYNKFIASEVKLALLKYYKDDTKIFFVRAAGVKGIESIRKINLYELDRQEDIDYMTSVYIPKDTSNSYDFNDLLEIMDKLKGEDGCPWDKEQNHQSLKKYLIEESYEALEAIDENDEEKLTEELGDVLFQVVFHAAIGKEEGYFDISDVIKKICEKMVLRHPHVFADEKVKDSGEVLYNWDKIKKKEQGHITITEELRHIAKVLPGLMRAEKVQKKAAKVGFDWDKVEDALEKILEEYYEVKKVYNRNNKAKIQEEIGDLIFSAVNVARFLDIDPEVAVNCTTDKFIKRFEYIENYAAGKGINLESMSLQSMDKLWEEAKNKENP